MSAGGTGPGKQHPAVRWDSAQCGNPAMPVLRAQACAEHGEEKEMSLSLSPEKGEEGERKQRGGRDHMRLWFRKATPDPKARAHWGSLLPRKCDQENEDRRGGEGEQRVKQRRGPNFRHFGGVCKAWEGGCGE